MPATSCDTWLRLLHWDKGQTESERFAADILQLEGFQSIDPAHPLGGPDGLKDMLLRRDARRWIAAAHFPNGQQRFSDTQKKFIGDLKGVSVNDVEGFAFVTNQELTLGQRDTLTNQVGGGPCEIYHLERLRAILDGLRGVRVRERYLSIPASHADVLAAVGQLEQLGQVIAATATTALAEELRRTVTLDVSPTDEYSFAELARLAQVQGKSEMHRGYVINQNMLPALANPEHEVPPIIILDNFPADIANCYRVAHEVAMLLFFLQRCIGLSHVEQLNHDERIQIVQVVGRLWRCTIRLRPLVNTCQSTLLMVGASRMTSTCAHLMVYMCASHFLQEVIQASEQTGYTTASKALSDAREDDLLPYDEERLAMKWPDAVRSLRNNFAIHEGYRLLSDAFNDLSSEAARAARYEMGLPIVPAWMRMLESKDVRD